MMTDARKLVLPGILLQACRVVSGVTAVNTVRTAQATAAIAQIAQSLYHQTICRRAAAA